MSQKDSEKPELCIFVPWTDFDNFWTSRLLLWHNMQCLRSRSTLHVLEEYEKQTEKVLVTYKPFLWTKEKKFYQNNDVHKKTTFATFWPKALTLNKFREWSRTLRQSLKLSTWEPPRLLSKEILATRYPFTSETLLLHSHKFSKKHHEVRHKNIYHRMYVTYNRNPKSMLYFSNNQNHKEIKLTHLQNYVLFSNFLSSFDFWKHLDSFCPNFFANRALFNCTRTFQMPALVAAETFTWKVLRIISRSKQRCLWLSVPRVTAILQILRVCKKFESLFQIKKRSRSCYKIVHRLKILIAIQPNR